MTKPIEILPYEGEEMNYFQGTAKMTWALLDPKNRIMHPPVMCKDYLPDAFWSEKTDKPVDVYGFKWKPGRLSMTLDTYKFQIVLTDEAVKKLSNISSLLGLWDKQLGFEPSKIIETTTKNTYVLEVDKAWVKQPVRISLLTLLVRIGTNYEGEAIADFLNKIVNGETKVETVKDGGYVRSSKDMMLKIFESKKWPKQAYSDYSNYNSMHNMSGIVSVAAKNLTFGED